jgi:hypothetical protein
MDEFFQDRGLEIPILLNARGVCGDDQDSSNPCADFGGIRKRRAPAAIRAPRSVRRD